MLGRVLNFMKLSARQLNHVSEICLSVLASIFDLVNLIITKLSERTENRCCVIKIRIHMGPNITLPMSN